MSLTPKNWATFQHYKDRKPAWIKLHHSILDDYKFGCLPVASKALAPLLWLLASEYEGGEITASLEEIAFRLRITPLDLSLWLKPLIDSGFFTLASEVLADPEHSASLEIEREKDSAYAAREARAPEFDMEPVDEEPKTKLFRKGKTILVSLGITEKRSGAVLGTWLKQKNDPIGILAALEYAVDHNVVEPVGYVTRLLNQKGQPNGTAKGAELAFQLAEEARELERAAGVGRPPHA